MKLQDQHQIKPETQSCQTSVSGSVMASELRIGNLIYKCYPDGKEIVSVESISKHFINGLGISAIEPIPITEELLYKIGAIKLDFKDFPSFNLFGTQINFVNGLWIEYVSRVEIKGLHHLQNIFFFRNSEELQVGCLTDR